MRVIQQVNAKLWGGEGGGDCSYRLPTINFPKEEGLRSNPENRESRPQGQGASFRAEKGGDGGGGGVI